MFQLFRSAEAARLRTLADRGPVPRAWSRASLSFALAASCATLAATPASAATEPTSQSGSPNLTVTGPGGPAGDVSDEWIGAAGTPILVSFDEPRPESVNSLRVSVAVGDKGFPEKIVNCNDHRCKGTHVFELTSNDPHAGSQRVSVRVRDDAGQTVAAHSWDRKFDINRPELVLSGSLADAAERALTEPTYELRLQTSDDEGGSGAFNLETQVDGQLRSNADARCATSACTISDRFIYHRQTFGTGYREIGVVATDRAGNTTRKRWHVGSKDPAAGCDGFLPDPNLRDCPTPLDRCIASDPVDSGQAEGTLSSGEAVKRIEEAHPEAVASSSKVTVEGQTIEPELKSSEVGYASTHTLAPGAFPAKAADGFSIGFGYRQVCLQPLDVADSALPAAKKSDSLVYANTYDHTDTIVRPTALGAEVLQNVRSADAPEVYRWAVRLTRGQELQTLEDGSVAVVTTPQPAPDDPTVTDLDRDPRNGENLAVEAPDSSTPAIPPSEASSEPDAIADTAAQVHDGKVALSRAEEAVSTHVTAVIGRPWARDASGDPVPVRLEVKGDTIEMHVDHRRAGVEYPVLADPPVNGRWNTAALTWNVLGFGRANWGGNWPAFDAWDFTARLKETAVPIMGFQEICKYQLDSIQYVMGLYGIPVFVKHARAWDPGAGCAFGNGVLTSFPAYDGRETEIPQTYTWAGGSATSGEKRSIASATIRLTDTGQVGPCASPNVCTRFSSTHISPPYQGDPTNSYHEIRWVADFLNNQDAPGWTRKMIVGDFNFQPYDAITDRQYGYVQALAPMYGFMNEVDTGSTVKTYPTIGWVGMPAMSRKIDHMFIPWGTYPNEAIRVNWRGINMMTDPHATSPGHRKLSIGLRRVFSLFTEFSPRRRVC